jgi:hypothetical protein
MVAGPFLDLTLLILSKLSFITSTVSAVQLLVDSLCDCTFRLVCTFSDCAFRLACAFTQLLTLLCTLCSSLSLCALILGWHYLGSLNLLWWPLLCCLLYISESNHCLQPQDTSTKVKTEDSLHQATTEDIRKLQIQKLKKHKAALQLSLTIQCNFLAKLRKELHAPEPDWIKKEPEC